MNADQIREIFREELNMALAAFFNAGTLQVADQQGPTLDDQIKHALRLPELIAETERQRVAAAERKARKLARRAQ